MSSRAAELLLVLLEPLPRPPEPLAEPLEGYAEPSGMASSLRMLWCAPWPTVIALYVVTCIRLPDEHSPSHSGACAPLERSCPPRYHAPPHGSHRLLCKSWQAAELEEHNSLEGSGSE